MIQMDKIQDALLHLIGWKQTTANIEGATISSTLTESESGLYFQQAHPLITLDNLFSVAPTFQQEDVVGQFEAYKAPVMSNLRAVSAPVKKHPGYKKGDTVLFAGRLYKAKSDIKPSSPMLRAATPAKVNTPATQPELWAETNMFSEWLEDKVKGSISKAVTRFINDKLSNGTSKALCENKVLFDGAGRLTDTIPNRNNLVGFEIVPIRANGVTTKINRIGLQFTMPGVYRLYLMNSSSYEPVTVIEVEKTKKGFEWVTVDDLVIPYSSDYTDAGGSWYLCYKQSELPEGSMAINKNRDWSKGPCKSCSRGEYLSWQAWSKYLEIHPFSIKESEGELEMWDPGNNIYEYDKNFGLNLDISVSCDLTNFIIEQKHLFQDVILKQFAVDVLREFAFNPNVRTNRHSINASRIDILYELDGDSAAMKKSGLNYQLEQAFKAIDFSTRGLYRICLPCKNGGIKYRTV